MISSEQNCIKHYCKRISIIAVRFLAQHIHAFMLLQWPSHLSQTRLQSISPELQSKKKDNEKRITTITKKSKSNKKVLEAEERDEPPEG